MREKIKKYLQTYARSKNLWMIVFIFILLIGAFLRTYSFHDWLQFRGDQSRDAYRMDQVLSGEAPLPLLGPFLSHSGATEEQSFHVGPIYYYFQIVSEKIFGNYPDKMAYPDVLFSILSLPLFFFFLRIYFSRNLSLALTGIYSISAYIISYSRFAWSCNPIPFFVLLFLFSLFKLLEKNEKTPWVWIVSLGFAWGVGFQLHAITMILFSLVAFIVFIFSMKKNPHVWKKWVAVLVLFFALNITQVISELNTNFANTKAFFHSQDTSSSVGTLTLIKNDIECHIEANLLYISSYGASFALSNCSHTLSGAFLGDSDRFFSKKMIDRVDNTVLLVGFFFSIIGYLLFIFYNKNENDNYKKYFLRLIALYCGIGFLIMLPLSKGNINDLRYFSFVFFVPFVFLGFLVKFLSEKYNRKYIVVPIIILFLLLVISNGNVLVSKATTFLDKNVTCSSSATLGEMEPIVDYMVPFSNAGKIYLKGDRKLAVAVDSLAYLAGRQGVAVVRFAKESDVTSVGESAFYVSCGSAKDMEENSLYTYQKIGNIYVYHIDKTE